MTKPSLIYQLSVLVKPLLGSGINPAAVSTAIFSRFLFPYIQGICGDFVYETLRCKLCVISNYRK